MTHTTKVMRSRLFPVKIIYHKRKIKTQLIIVCCIHGIVCICLLCFYFPFVIYNLHREKAASHNFSCMCHKMAALEILSFWRMDQNAEINKHRQPPQVSSTCLIHIQGENKYSTITVFFSFVIFFRLYLRCMWTLQTRRLL
jgi:hypothetical protein